MGIIYKITNRINGKIYIGQTSRDISVRWCEHKSRANCHQENHLYSAMQKYGIDNFYIEKIEDVQIKDLDKREKYWISYYDSSDPRKGYNLTVGGQGNTNYSSELIRKLWDQGYSVGQIVTKIGCNKSTVRKSLIGHPGYSTHESLSRRVEIRKGVNKYDLEGNFIANYKSIIEAAEYDEGKVSGISGCCRGKGVSAHGFQWRYDSFEGEVGSVVDKRKFGKRKIIQLDLNDNVIATFVSAAEAARQVAPGRNVNSASSGIIQVCKGNQNTAYGFKWQYGE